MHNIKSLMRLQSAMIILLTFVVAGCRDDLFSIPDKEIDDPGREVLMPVSLDVESIVTLNSETRGEDGVDSNTRSGYADESIADPTVSEDETRLHDFWLLQYNSAGIRVGMPHYQEYTGEGEKPVVPFLVPTVKGNKFTTVIIANTGDPKLFTDENSSTVRKVKNVHKPMENADAVWVVIDDKRHLPMSGKMDVDMNTRSISVNIRPNVAKLRLYFKLMKMSDGTGDAGGGNSWDRKRRTYAVNWGNVPDLPYADILYEADNYNDDVLRFPSSVNPAKLNLFPVSTDKKVMNELIGTALDFSDRPMSFDVYLPRNTQGINQNTDPYQKSTYATEHSLFLEIVCADKEQTKCNKFRRIEFLPGGNDVNDYNIIPGKYYLLDFTFSNFPTDDGPVNKLYRRYPEANAYIVNPHDTRIVNRFPISPVNNYATSYYPGYNNVSSKNYWEEVYYNIYEQELKSDTQGTLTQDPVTWESRDIWFTNQTISGTLKGLPFAILPSTQWVAEVIWQDRPERLINFCDYLGLPTNNGDYYESSGAMWLPVKIADLNNFKQTFLVLGGKYNTLDPTNFKDPINDRNPTKSEIFFKTTGLEGNVIVGIRKKTDQEKAGGEPPALVDREYLWSWHLWITDYNPAALSQSTMDRNIGAMKPGDVGFYYQYNRKDPFPRWDAKVYDINGNELSQLSHEVGPDGNKTRVSMLCYQHAGKTAAEKTAAKLKGINSPFTLLYHTNKSTSVTGTAGYNYAGEAPSTWSVSSTNTTYTNSWTPEDPSPQGWVLPADEKQPEVLPGSWTVAESWEGLDIPVSGLLSDPYTSNLFEYIFRPEGSFLWVKAFRPTDLNADKTGIAPNTTNVKGPYYPIGSKMKVDALPVRCMKKK